MTETTSSATAQLRVWIKEQIDRAVAENRGVSTAALTQQAMAHFATDDPGFLHRLVAERVQPVIQTVVVETLGQTRNYVLRGDRATPRAQFAAEAARLGKRWERWMEHVGDASLPVLAMRKGDLFAAASERQRSGQQQLRMAALWTALGERLQDDERVGDRFTTEQIEELYRSLEGEV